MAWFIAVYLILDSKDYFKSPGTTLVADRFRGTGSHAHRDHRDHTGKTLLVDEGTERVPR